MEECVHLVCKILGINEDDEVSVEKVGLLYQKVFFTPAHPDDIHRAIAQVRMFLKHSKLCG